MAFELRPHQLKAKADLYSALRAGEKRIVMQAPVAWGKTAFSASVIMDGLKGGRRAIFSAPALSLIDQTVERFYEYGINDIGVMQASHPMTAPHRPVQVCSTQTLARRQIPDGNIVLIDECFIAGTMINTPCGTIPIEKIEPGSIVANATGTGIVIARSKRIAKTLILIGLSNGSQITTTHNHPIFTDRGWVEAGKLEVGSRAYRQEDVSCLCGRFFSSQGGPEWSSNCDSQAKVGEDEFLFNILRSEASEPNAFGRREECGERETKGNRPRSESSRRERPGHERSTSSLAELTSGWMDGGAYTADPRTLEDGGMPEALQDRHCEQGVEDSHRNRRALSRGKQAARTGCSQGSHTEAVWVESVETYECPGGEFVYNLQISGHPSYYANGILVHNCHMRHESVYRWMNDPEWADVPFVGLTATPWARGMGKNWKHLLVASTMADMAEQGWLKKLRYFSPMQIDASAVKMVAGDYHEGQLSAASSTKTILANTVQQWMEKAHDRATIAFCVDRAHAQAMQARFIECGIPCDYIDANTDGDERKAIGKRMERGQTRVTVSVGCLIAGLDWTFVSCVLFARKTKSPMLWVQGIGRGLRLHPGQEDCILLDCAGNSHLGHPFDIHFDKLDDGSKKDREARKKEAEKIREPKACPKCGAFRPAGVRVCPECGFTPQLQSTVVELDGDLAEVGRGGKVKKKDPVSHEDMQEWYSSLLAIQDERGYKKGWAANNLREKFGQWPEKLNLHDAALDFPSPMVSSWVKHRMIKFAKGKSKA